MPDSGSDHAAHLVLLADDLERLERRLRGLSTAAWRSRADVIRALLLDLIAIEATVNAASGRVCPSVPEHALADALAVIGGDVIDAIADGGPGESLEAALSTVRSALAATR
jgi:hypothetical protein